MWSDSNERYIGLMAITSHGVRTVYENYFKNEYADFFGAVSSNTTSLKVFKNSDKCRRLANNEIQMLKLLSGNEQNFTVQLRDDYEFMGHKLLALEPFSYTLAECFKQWSYEETDFHFAAVVAKPLLKALDLLRRKNIVHRNIKPGNFYVLESGDVFRITLGGFEHACITQNLMIGTTQTLHYRAPEVLLGLPYDKAIDVWSFGCSIFEIAVGHVLFHGEDELDQICRIMEVLGHFPNYMIEGSPRKDEFFDYMESEGRYYPKNYFKYLPPGVRSLSSLMSEDIDLNTSFENFLKMMLKSEPKLRLSPDMIIKHQFLLLPDLL